MHDAFIRSTCDSPTDKMPRLIYADWLEEQGDPRCVAWRAELFAPAFKPFRSGYGYGYGYGSGSGSGYGDGSGYGSGYGSKLFTGEKMEPKTAWLIHCGDYHTYCGRVVCMVTPLLYQFECVSKIRHTKNGDCWERLAAGEGGLRQQAEYRHYQTTVLLPVTIAAIEWLGELPAEVAGIEMLEAVK